MKSYIIPCVMLLSVLFMGEHARASMIVAEDPIITGSWMQRTEFISTMFDRLEFSLTASDDHFAGNGVEDFYGSGEHWNSILSNDGQHVTAYGDDTDDLFVNLHFWGDIYDAKDMFISLYHDDFLEEMIHASYYGNGNHDGWHIETGCGDCNDWHGDCHKIPEPSMLLLFGAGLSALAVLIKKTSR